MSGRTPFFVFSVAAHVGLAFGLGRMHVSESHAATAIEIADVKKKAEPPKALVDTEPPKPEHHAPVHRAAAAPPPPAQNTPPPPTPRARVALADTSLPDFGVSLTGAVGGDGIALPAGGSLAATAAPVKSAPVHRALAAAVGPSSTEDTCDEPPAKPHPVNVPQPAYNANARAAGIEGKVRVRLTVDETGKVVDVAVIAGLGYGLDEAALAAAREATFEPALRCGKPVRATFTISMRFTAG